MNQLRLWIIIVALVSICGSDLQGAETDERIVCSIEELGGIVTRDASAPGKPVIKVELGSGGMSDVVLFQSLSELRELNIAFSGVTDEGLKNIKKLPKIQFLN